MAAPAPPGENHQETADPVTVADATLPRIATPQAAFSSQ